MRTALACATLLLGCAEPRTGGIDALFVERDDLARAVDAARPSKAPEQGATRSENGEYPLAHLSFFALDGETQALIPARVIFRPVPGAGFADSVTSGAFDPLSRGSSTGAQLEPGVIGSPEGVILIGGAGSVDVPPGDYSLLFARGPEYELSERYVQLDADESRTVTVTLDRAVDTRGWLAADMHVHTQRSFDSQLPEERRVASMVSNGVEIIVATDHNVNTDLAPAAASLGYGPKLVGTIVGDEFNFGEGHGGAYPTTYQPTQPFGGAPPWQPQYGGQCGDPAYGINCLHAHDAFTYMHQQIAATTVVTINHPFWAGADLGYFTNVAWGAGTDHGLGTLDSLGTFDALEVLNGYQTNDAAENNLVADWFYMLNQGYRVTALGSSDTHRINWVRGGWPRTWLRLPNDAPGETTGAGLADAVRNHRAIASTGPFITLTVDRGQIGDEIVPQNRDGLVTVRVMVDAPFWIDLTLVKVFINGELLRKFPVTRVERPRFVTTFTTTITEDSWIVAFASGDKPLPPDIVGEYSHANHYEMKPWAITNPVFIDADGDGSVHPFSPQPGPKPTRHESQSPFEGEVGQACDPTELIGTEPPLEAPENVVMPLLR